MSASQPDEPIDLSEIALNLKKRMDPKRNAELLRNPDVKEFLEAGMRLLKKEFARRESGDASGHDDYFPAVSHLGRKDIATEAQRVNPKLTENRFRGLWEFLPAYLGDLIRYALGSSHWSPHFTLVEKYENAVSDTDLVDLAKDLAYEDLALVRSHPDAMRFQFFAAAFAERDQRTNDALASAYGRITARWEAFYGHVLASRSITLRPGITTADVTEILHATMEGLSLRLLGDAASVSKIVDEKARTNLLEIVALALIAACVDTGDHLSLDDHARELMAGLRPDAGD